MRVRKQPGSLGGKFAPRALALASLLLLPAAPASAIDKNCYDGFAGGGCPWKSYLKEGELRPLACENLAFMRNRIYKENSYCFRLPEAKAKYGNEGCKWPLQELVPLNAYEKANVALIRKVEVKNRCKGGV